MNENITKVTFDNGLQVIVEKDDNSRAVTLKYVVACGSFDEEGTYQGENNFGISHFIEHMLFKGTKKRTVDDINNDIAAIGGMTNAYTSFDRTAFYISMQSEKWKEGLEILNDIFWNSTLPEEELEKERTVIIEELKMYDDDPADRCLEQLSIIANSNNENRQRVAGTVESVRKLKREDLISYMQRFYVPNNICLVVAGNIDVDELIEEEKKYIEDKEKGNLIERTQEYNEETLTGQVSRIYKDDICQAHLSFLIKGIPQDDRVAVQEIISSLLGGGFTSRLYKIIREQLGLAYTVSVNTSNFRDCSYMEGYVGLDPDNISKAYRVIAQELNKLKYELVDEKELEILKAVLKGHMILYLESTSAKTNTHENNFIFGSDKSIDEILQEIDEVTKEDIMQFAKDFFNKHNICISIVQPKIE